MLKYIKSLWAAMLVGAMLCNSTAAEDLMLRTPAQVTAAIKKELPVGATSSDIESFFVRNNIIYGWNQFEKHYNGVIHESRTLLFFRVRYSISIVIYVDSDRKFVGADVHGGYTLP